MMQFNDLSEADYKKFADFIYSKCGIHLGENKQELLRTRLMKRLRILNLSSFKDYYDYVVKHDEKGDELVELLNVVSTNYTFFFRENQHFDFMKATAIPSILASKTAQKSNRIRAWCAAASTGEEPYSIVMTMLDSLGINSSWDFKLLATDISTKVLTKAYHGIYDAEKTKTLSPQLLEKYFDKVDFENKVQHKIKSDVRSHITYKRFNLMTETFPFKGKFDFIFCRNVMIYFDVQTQIKLVQKMINCLNVGGYLLIGHSESLSNNFRDQLKVHASATFQRIR